MQVPKMRDAVRAPWVVVLLLQQFAFLIFKVNLVQWPV
jgi:hypothetical protein